MKKSSKNKKTKKSMPLEDEVVRFLSQSDSDNSSQNFPSDKRIQRVKNRDQFGYIRLVFLEKIINFIIALKDGLLNFFLSSFKKLLLKYRIKKKNKVLEIQKDQVEDVFAPQVKFMGITLPYGWQKAMVAFLVVLILLILPLFSLSYMAGLLDVKNKVVGLTFEAYKHLLNGQTSINELDFNSASGDFKAAADKFKLAKKEIDDLDFLTMAVLKTMPDNYETLMTGFNLLSVGQNLSQAGYNLFNGINFLFNNNNIDLTTKFSLFNSELSLALADVAEARENISQSNLSLLEPYGANLMADEFPRVEQKLEEFTVLSEMMLKFLGQDQWKRYLLIFQNNNEIRATGGFMGSYALLDIDRGKIKNLEIPGGGTYDLQGALKKDVASPQPLNLINPRWEFQDANWWPDFPTTAKKIIWFYENSDGPTADGVIAVNSSIMEDLLKITGPVSMPEYNKVITSENFEAETQNIVELEYDKSDNKPKQFLADLAPVILEELGKIDRKDFPELIEIFYNNLQMKNISFYFSDKQLQNLVSAFNWAGQILPTNSDYLAVISTNIAGGKTDAVIKTNISHQAEISKNGTVVDTITITKKHQGEKPNIFTGVQNNDYIRIYVPLGSTLLSADGFSTIPQELFESTSGLEADSLLAAVETDKTIDPVTNTQIYNESNKTVFANWFQIKPGEEKSVVLKYELPFRFNDYYSLLAQKQSGKDDINLTSTINYAQGFNIKNIYPSSVVQQNNSIIFNKMLNKDLFYGFSIER